MASHDAADNPTAFSLSGDSDEFKSKKTDVFGSLDALERSYQSKLAGRPESDNKRDSDLRDQSDPAENDENDRAFKRPRSPGQLRGSALTRRTDFRSRAWTRREASNHGRRNPEPDFEANPSKWQKYSLEETAVCGNAQNSTVAFDLIRSLKERRGQEDAAEMVDLDQKIIFSKPEATPEREKKKTCGDVHKMEEYQFGTKVAKKVTTVQSDSASAQSTSLGSLSFEHPKDEDRECSDAADQLDRSPGTSDQSESSKEGEEEMPVAQQKDGQIDDGQQVSVGFKKKRKGQRNIRNRQDDDD